MKINQRTLTKPFLIAAGLLLVAAPAATAQDAKAWLDKLGKRAGRAVQTDMVSTIDSEGMKANVQAQMSYGDKTHFMMDMKMEMTMAAMGQTEPTAMAMKMVADGETLWMEMDNAMMGGLQVMKLPVSMMSKLEQSGMSMSLTGGTEMDPVQQMIDLAEMADFDVVKSGNGQVVMTGAFNDKGLESMAQPGTMMGVDLTNVTMVLDEGTGFPVEMSIGTADKAIITSKYLNPVFPEQVDLAQFTYSPPEGVNVMDLSAMMGAAGGESDY